MRVAVVGHVEWVEFVRVPHMPAAGEIVHAESWWEEPGGGGANSAVQLRKLAGAVSFYTALGADELGRRARRELGALGVEVHASERAEPTRRAVTHVDPMGERTITVLGDRLAPSGRDRLPWAELEGMDAVYFTAGDDAALKHARRARVLVATSRVLPLLTKSGVRLDALVGSANDASERFSASDLEPPPHLSVWTNGELGGTYTEKGRSGRYRSVAATTVVDRYGAGDSFAAALTYGLGAGMTTEDALELSARCGAAVVAGAGPYSTQLGIQDI